MGGVKHLNKVTRDANPSNPRLGAKGLGKVIRDRVNASNPHLGAKRLGHITPPTRLGCKRLRKPLFMMHLQIVLLLMSLVSPCQCDDLTDEIWNPIELSDDNVIKGESKIVLKTGFWLARNYWSIINTYRAEVTDAIHIILPEYVKAFVKAVTEERKRQLPGQLPGKISLGAFFEIWFMDEKNRQNLQTLGLAKKFTSNKNTTIRCIKRFFKEGIQEGCLKSVLGLETSDETRADIVSDVRFVVLMKKMIMLHPKSSMLSCSWSYKTTRKKAAIAEWMRNIQKESKKWYPYTAEHKEIIEHLLVSSKNWKHIEFLQQRAREVTCPRQKAVCESSASSLNDWND